MTPSKTINDLTRNDILRVYSGKANCCFCGCSGTHYYNPDHLEEVREKRKRVTLEDCNSRMVTKIFNIIKKNIDGADRIVDTNVSVFIGKRDYMVYFTKAFLASAGIKQ